MSLAPTFNLRTALIVIVVIPAYAAVKFLIGHFSHIRRLTPRDKNSF